MDTISSQRSNLQNEADRLQQDHMKKVRDIKRAQESEMTDMVDKHQRDMRALDEAYKVEITSKEDEYATKIAELDNRKQNQLAILAKQSDQSLKMAQDTYKQQAEELRANGERRLAKMRDDQAVANENIERKGAKANA